MIPHDEFLRRREKNRLYIEEKYSLIKIEWAKYKEFLMGKYPPEDGKEWEFTCEHHKAIEGIINRRQK